MRPKRARAREPVCNTAAVMPIDGPVRFAIHASERAQNVAFDSSSMASSSPTIQVICVSHVELRTRAARVTTLHSLDSGWRSNQERCRTRLIINAVRADAPELIL